MSLSRKSEGDIVDEDVLSYSFPSVTLKHTTPCHEPCSSAVNEEWVIHLFSVMFVGGVSNIIKLSQCCRIQHLSAGNTADIKTHTIRASLHDG